MVGVYDFTATAGVAISSGKVKQVQQKSQQKEQGPLPWEWAYACMSEEVLPIFSAFWMAGQLENPAGGHDQEKVDIVSAQTFVDCIHKGHFVLREA